MALNFDALPKDKPNSNNAKEGRYNAVVFKTEMKVSKTNGSEYLNVSFRTDEGAFVNENYFDSDKPFLQYKLGRLLKACNVTLKGNGTLKDVAKVIKDKRVTIDVAVNDRGYGSLDYSGSNEGIYSIVETKDLPFNDSPEARLDAELDKAIEADVTMLDEDF